MPTEEEVLARNAVPSPAESSSEGSDQETQQQPQQPRRGPRLLPESDVSYSSNSSTISGSSRRLACNERGRRSCDVNLFGYLLAGRGALGMAAVCLLRLAVSF